MSGTYLPGPYVVRTPLTEATPMRYELLAPVDPELLRRFEIQAVPVGAGIHVADVIRCDPWTDYNLVLFQQAPETARLLGRMLRALDELLLHDDGPLGHIRYGGLRHEVVESLRALGQRS